MPTQKIDEDERRRDVRRRGLRAGEARVDDEHEDRDADRAADRVEDPRHRDDAPLARLLQARAAATAPRARRTTRRARPSRAQPNSHFGIGRSSRPTSPCASAASGTIASSARRHGEGGEQAAAVHGGQCRKPPAGRAGRGAARAATLPPVRAPVDTLSAPMIPAGPGVGERREPADGQAARAAGARRVLGLLPRQLAAHAALRARLARALRGGRPARDLRARRRLSAVAGPGRGARRGRRLGIEHPVVIDADFALWREYGNEAWPARYLFDRRLRLHSMHYGEGAYDETEREICELLELRVRAAARRCAPRTSRARRCARRRPSSRAPGPGATRPAAYGPCSSARRRRTRRRPRSAPTAARSRSRTPAASRSSSTSATPRASSSSRSATA